MSQSISKERQAFQALQNELTLQREERIEKLASVIRFAKRIRCDKFETLFEIFEIIDEYK